MSSPESRVSVRRVALTEVARRAVNEEVVPGPEAGWDISVVERRCECGAPGCEAPLRLTVEEYEELRADPRRFAVLPEHVVHAAERVVERRSRYAIVEKVAEAGAIAEASDPRAG